MHGEPENVVVNDNGSIIEVERGDKGAALINLSEETVTIDLATSLKPGNYTDKVHGTTFEVKDGKISGEMQPLTSYIIY